MLVQTLDISKDGCAILSPQPLPENALWNLTIYANCDGHPVEISGKGKIVYCMLSGTKGYRAGIQFTYVDRTSKALIEKIIARAINLI